MGTFDSYIFMTITSSCLSSQLTFKLQAPWSMDLGFLLIKLCAAPI